jgi:hypothetical protein
VVCPQKALQIIQRITKLPYENFELLQKYKKGELGELGTDHGFLVSAPFWQKTVTGNRGLSQLQRAPPMLELYRCPELPARGQPSHQWLHQPWRMELWLPYLRRRLPSRHQNQKLPRRHRLWQRQQR